jgi:hypothetical protein
VPHGVLMNLHCQKVMFNYLSASNVSTKLKTGIMRVVEEDYIDAVREVFGTTFGVGCCISGAKYQDDL